MHEVKPNSFLSDQHPNIEVTPTFHRVFENLSTVVKLVLVNLSNSIYVSQQE